MLRYSPLWCLRLFYGDCGCRSMNLPTSGALDGVSLDFLLTTDPQGPPSLSLLRQTSPTFSAVRLTGLRSLVSQRNSLLPISHVLALHLGGCTVSLYPRGGSRGSRRGGVLLRFPPGVANPLGRAASFTTSTLGLLPADLVARPCTYRHESWGGNA